MIDIGVANPNAQGQAIMRTAIAFSSAWPIRGSGPTRLQTAKDAMAMAITSGTNHPEIRSATACIGARLRCASATMRIMRASIVSLPTACVSMTRLPVPFTVPPVSALAISLATGKGSPVSIDSSTDERPIGEIFGGVLREFCQTSSTAKMKMRAVMRGVMACFCRIDCHPAN
jgi:hypothetical protein